MKNKNNEIPQENDENGCQCPFCHLERIEQESTDEDQVKIAEAILSLLMRLEKIEKQIKK